MGRKIVLWIVAGCVLLAALGLGFCFMATRMPGESHAGPLPPLTLQEQDLVVRLQQHSVTLAESIGPRNARFYRALAMAETYIQDRLEEFGYAVTPQKYEIRDKPFRNLSAEIPGREDPSKIILIGAHYDTAGTTPGADDNASAVAVLLELARLMATAPPPKYTVRFAAFVNEEPPFFMTSEMGSRVYARAAKRRGDDIQAMICLEMVGYYTDAPKSQRFPFPLGLFYPDKGDFIAFVGNMDSGALTRRAIKTFRATTPFPSQGAALPTIFSAITLSDHRSFWNEGYQAVMVTDTSFYRNPHYHKTSDTSDTLDYDRMARVASGLLRVVQDLAGDETAIPDER